MVFTENYMKYNLQGNIIKIRVKNRKCQKNYTLFDCFMVKNCYFVFL